MAAKMNLNLDRSNSTKSETIYHSLHYRGKRFRISTGQSIEPKHWDNDKAKQQVRRTKQNFDSYNKLLKKQQSDIERIILNLELTGKPVTKENIVIQLDWTNSIEVKDFKPLSLFTKFIEVYGSDKADRTKKGYSTTLSHLTKYELSTAVQLTFKDFNEDFYKQFRDFLGMFDNSFGFHVKNVKTFLNWANDKGYNEHFLFRKWKIPNEDGKSHFFLKSTEIQILANTDFDNRLNKVRDLFLIGCYSGLRYSDILTLKPVHVENGLITKIAKKTNDFVKIPIIPELQDILNKYWINEKSLPQITNQKGNEYLKELAKKAGLIRNFNYIQKRNKTSTETTFEAWQMMTWHIARHSFITNCIQFEVPQDVVRRVVGHKSFKTLEKYIQNDDDFNKKQVMKISKSFQKLTV